MADGRNRASNSAPSLPEEELPLGEDGPNFEAPGVRKSYSIAVLNRAIDILEIFSPTQPSLGLKDIVRQTGLPKTTVFRILSSLVERGYCEVNSQTGEYSLGFVFLKYADLRRRQTSLYAVGAPLLRKIRDTLDETVVLTIRAGDYRVHIDCVETRRQLKRTVSVGVPAPLYIGASGKVLLAGMGDAEIHDYLQRTELLPVQETTITDVDALWEEIEAIRANGYAESRGELISGGGALAAPLRDYSGSTVAAVDIITPAMRYTEGHRKRCLPLLLEETLTASKALGYLAS